MSATVPLPEGRCVCGSRYFVLDSMGAVSGEGTTFLAAKWICEICKRCVSTGQAHLAGRAIGEAAHARQLMEVARRWEDNAVEAIVWRRTEWHARLSGRFATGQAWIGRARLWMKADAWDHKRPTERLEDIATYVADYFAVRAVTVMEANELYVWRDGAGNLCDAPGAPPAFGNVPEEPRPRPQWGTG